METVTSLRLYGACHDVFRYKDVTEVGKFTAVTCRTEICTYGALNLHRIVHYHSISERHACLSVPLLSIVYFLLTAFVTQVRRRHSYFPYLDDEIDTEFRIDKLA